MRRTVENANNWPNNYNSDSQLRMVERFKYLLHMSDKLVLQTEFQKNMLIQTRLTLNAKKTMEEGAEEEVVVEGAEEDEEVVEDEVVEEGSGGGS